MDKRRAKRIGRKTARDRREINEARKEKFAVSEKFKEKFGNRLDR